MKKIGITGGIGSGKSYVSRRLQELFQIPVYDCDSRAKTLMQTDAEIRAGLEQMFGKEVYDEAGWLNRPLLAAYIFGDKAHLANVNALVHPRVKHDFRAWAEEQDCEIVAVESAILYSSRMNDAVDYVIGVTAPEEVRIGRVQERGACTREQVLDRMQSQQNENGTPDYELLNDGVASVDKQLEEILRKIEIEY